MLLCPMISSLIYRKKQACLKFVCVERTSISIINIKKQSPIYLVFFEQMILWIVHHKKCVSLKINPVESTSMLMILWDLQMPQTEGSEALGWPGKKACVFTLQIVLLESFSGTPCTCMLKKNSRTLSQDLGLINPGQGPTPMSRGAWSCASWPEPDPSPQLATIHQLISSRSSLPSKNFSAPRRIAHGREGQARGVISLLTLD